MVVHRPGKPKSARTNDIVEKINNAMLNDRSVKVQKSVDTVKISDE